MPTVEISSPALVKFLASKAAPVFPYPSSLFESRSGGFEARVTAGIEGDRLAEASFCALLRLEEDAGENTGAPYRTPPLGLTLFRFWRLQGELREILLAAALLANDEICCSVDIWDTKRPQFDETLSLFVGGEVESENLVYTGIPSLLFHEPSSCGWLSRIADTDTPATIEVLTGMHRFESEWSSVFLVRRYAIHPSLIERLHLPKSAALEAKLSLRDVRESALFERDILVFDDKGAFSRQLSLKEDIAPYFRDLASRTPLWSRWSFCEDNDENTVKLSLFSSLRDDEGLPTNERLTFVLDRLFFGA